MIKTLSLTDYPIFVGDFSNPLQKLLTTTTYSQVFILVDENTKACCLPILLEKVPSLASEATIIQIQSGEIHKNLTTCTFIWQQLLAANADRKALFINLGGGVIGDMGGFSAAAYKRGIGFIQIPTTLLAQVDASIGGKLGVDFQHVKNIIGFFKNPKAVFIDPNFLATLPDRQIKNGLAEIIKHALIEDADYWNLLEELTDIQTIDWSTIIYKSLTIKKKIVETDPFEKGVRKVLNFGHTIGHAVESYSLQYDEDPLLHGEAIAIGMVAELYLSAQKNNMPIQQVNQILTYLKNIYPVYPLQNHQFQEIVAYLKNDKKNEGKQLNFSLLTEIGKAVYNQQVSQEAIIEALKFYQKNY